MPERIVIVLELDTDPPGPPVWVVSSPDVPGLRTQGRTVASALEMAADAVRGLAAAATDPAVRGRREQGAK